jgi:predicted transcriptional regulator
MTSNVVSARAGQSIAGAVSLVAGRNFAFVPVVDGDGAVQGIVPVAQLRTADPEAAVATLMRSGHIIRCDASLLRAIVQMNDLDTRQLLVVDAESGTKLVGVLAMSDVVRAHARAASATDAHAAGSQRPGPSSDLRAASLMLPASVVLASAKLSELVQQLREGGTRAFVLYESPDDLKVVLPEQLNEFARDEDVERLLIAADLAHPAPPVDASADLSVLVRVLQGGGAEAAVVLAAETKSPIGVVTKNALARVVLEGYAGRSVPVSTRPAGPSFGAVPR